MRLRIEPRFGAFKHRLEALGCIRRALPCKAAEFRSGERNDEMVAPSGRGTSLSFFFGDPFADYTIRPVTFQAGDLSWFLPETRNTKSRICPMAHQGSSL